MTQPSTFLIFLVGILVLNVTINRKRTAITSFGGGVGVRELKSVAWVIHLCTDVSQYTKKIVEYCVLSWLDRNHTKFPYIPPPNPTHTHSQSSLI